jgi:hypothetical protein
MLLHADTPEVLLLKPLSTVCDSELHHCLQAANMQRHPQQQPSLRSRRPVTTRAAATAGRQTLQMGHWQHHQLQQQQTQLQAAHGM